uniref:Hypoxia up-regulated protein 1 n=1 Tax=Panagrolaimus superbus TaxID=310955 RepID=A0A914YXC6_9BILA
MLTSNLLDVDDYDPENEEDIIPITRDEFEKMAESYKVRITKVIFQSILKAKLTKEQIEYVFQVGGGCRMPMIKQLLLSTFPNANHQCNLYPDWVVAHGATLYAYHLENLKRNQQTKKYKIPSQCETYDPTFNAVGIDFGTTECCAAVVRKDGPYSILLDTCINLNRVMPLYVSFAEGQALFGQLVINRMKYFAKNSVFDIQKIIGKDFEEIVHNSLWPFKLVKNKEKVFIEVETVNGRENKSPEEIISLILEHVKTKIETFQDLQKFSRAFHVVLAIPFSYSERQKLSLQRAAVMAGFNSINFIPASIAAAFAYCAKNNILDQSNILICECEEGSTELCIAKMDTNEFEILSYENDSHLGGEDFDRLLFNHFDAILKRKYEINVTRTNAKYDLNQICRKIRHELFFRNEAWLHLDDFIFDNEEQIKITREDSENMSAELLLKIKRIINRVVLKANVSKESIRYVFHVGGGCQMPMIKNLLLDTFQMAYHKFHEYPEEVVAHGAALYAYHLQRSKIERGF